MYRGCIEARKYVCVCVCFFCGMRSIKVENYLLQVKNCWRSQYKCSKSATPSIKLCGGESINVFCNTCKIRFQSLLIPTPASTSVPSTNRPESYYTGGRCHAHRRARINQYIECSCSCTFSVSCYLKLFFCQKIYLQKNIFAKKYFFLQFFQSIFMSTYIHVLLWMQKNRHI